MYLLIADYPEHTQKHHGLPLVSQTHLVSHLGRMLSLERLHHSGQWAAFGSEAQKLTLSGITGLTVTVAVIMFELTGALTYILPTMVRSLIVWLECAHQPDCDHGHEGCQQPVWRWCRNRRPPDQAEWISLPGEGK